MAVSTPMCVLCIVFIIPASISAKLKFCIALCIDYEATAARSSVSCVKYDYRYRDWIQMWFDCVLWMSLFD